MFDVGWSEMLVIAIVLIVVVGPKDLPRMLRQFGRTTSKLRTMAGDFRRQFDEALKEAELDDVSETLNSVRKINPMNEIRKHLAPIEDVGQQVRAGLDEAMRPQSKVTPAETAAEPVAAEPLKTGATELPSEAAAPAVETSKPKRKTARAKAPEAKSGAKKAGAKSAPARSSAATLAKASTPKAAEVKTVSRKTSPKVTASKPPASKTTTAKASKAAPASAKRAPARTGPAGRKKTGSTR